MTLQFSALCTASRLRIRKRLLILFCGTLSPPHSLIATATYSGTESLGTQSDRCVRIARTAPLCDATATRFASQSGRAMHRYRSLAPRFRLGQRAIATAVRRSTARYAKRPTRASACQRARGKHTAQAKAMSQRV